MKLIVCGGRDYNDRQVLYKSLDRLLEQFTITCIIEGGQTGADRMAREWAIDRHIDYKTVEAEWTLFGKPAGPMRNRIMAAEADACAVFDGEDGTADMLKTARKYGLVVFLFHAQKDTHQASFKQERLF